MLKRYTYDFILPTMLMWMMLIVTLAQYMYDMVYISLFQLGAFRMQRTHAETEQIKTIIYLRLIK
jgi:hypothetical protein